MLILSIDLLSSIGHHNWSCNWFIYTNSDVCGKSSKSSPEYCHQLLNLKGHLEVLTFFFFFPHDGIHFNFMLPSRGV